MVKNKITFLLIILFIVLQITISVGEESKIDKEIIINIPSRTLTYIEGGKIKKTYPVAVGKAATQTPIGSFSVINKVMNPYYSRKDIPGGSPNNPLGVRWIGFKPHYGIHGNNAPDSIGTTASAGCVRMYTYDVKELYEKVNMNTEVTVTYDLFTVIHPGNEKLQGVVLFSDVYNHEKNLEKSIVEQLSQLNMLEAIPEEKITEAAAVSKNKNVVLSKQWAVIINQHYFSSDTYVDEEMIYICEKDLWLFFGLKIQKNEDADVTVNGIPVKYQHVDGRYYVLLDDIQNILGGNLEKNQRLQNIWYDIPIIKLNGVFLDVNKSGFSTHELIFSFELMNSILEKIGSGEKNIKRKNNAAPLEQVKNLYSMDYNVSSLDGRIDLYVTPEIIVEEKHVTAYEDGGNVFIDHYELVDDGYSPDKKLINILDLTDLYEIEENYYRTKYVLKLRH